VAVAAEIVGLRPRHTDGGGFKRAQIVRGRSVIDLPLDGLSAIEAKIAGLERNVFQHLAVIMDGLIGMLWVLHCIAI